MLHNVLESITRRFASAAAAVVIAGLTTGTGSAAQWTASVGAQNQDLGHTALKGRE